MEAGQNGQGPADRSQRFLAHLGMLGVGAPQVRTRPGAEIGLVALGLMDPPPSQVLPEIDVERPQAAAVLDVSGGRLGRNMTTSCSPTVTGGEGTRHRANGIKPETRSRCDEKWRTVKGSSEVRDTGCDACACVCDGDHLCSSHSALPTWSSRQRPGLSWSGSSSAGTETPICRWAAASGAGTAPGHRGAASGTPLARRRRRQCLEADRGSGGVRLCSSPGPRLCSQREFRKH